MFQLTAGQLAVVQVVGLAAAFVSVAVYGFKRAQKKNWFPQLRLALFLVLTLSILSPSISLQTANPATGQQTAAQQISAPSHVSVSIGSPAPAFADDAEGAPYIDDSGGIGGARRIAWEGLVGALIAIGCMLFLL